MECDVVLNGITGAVGLRPTLAALDAGNTLAGATFKVSRTISRDRVGTFLREPFVEGDAGEETEHPAGEGLQRAIGELVLCTRCIGTWVAAGLGTAQVVTPRFGRLLTWSFAAAAANDFLQTAFVALNNKSDALSDRNA